MTVGSQMPELDFGGFFALPPYKIGCQNTPYKLGLTLLAREGEAVFHFQPSKWLRTPKQNKPLP